jgi:hypothetical protein
MRRRTGRLGLASDKTTAVGKEGVTMVPSTTPRRFRRDTFMMLSWNAGGQSSGSTLTMEAPSLLPTQKLTGVVELSTKTRRMLVERGSR